MGYYSQLAAQTTFEDELYETQKQVRTLQKYIEKRDDHILWMRERLRDIAAMKDQPKARDVARQTLLDGMGGFDWKRPDH